MAFPAVTSMRMHASRVVLGNDALQRDSEKTGLTWSSDMAGMPHVGNLWVLVPIFLDAVLHPR